MAKKAPDGNPPGAVKKCPDRTGFRGHRHIDGAMTTAYVPVAQASGAIDAKRTDGITLLIYITVLSTAIFFIFLKMVVLQNRCLEPPTFHVRTRPMSSTLLLKPAIGRLSEASGKGRQPRLMLCFGPQISRRPAVYAIFQTPI